MSLSFIATARQLEAAGRGVYTKESWEALCRLDERREALIGGEGDGPRFDDEMASLEEEADMIMDEAYDLADWLIADI